MELCSECKPGRRRVKVRKSFTCADCGQLSYPPAQMGKLPERCDPCRAERARRKRQEISQRYRLADPERQKRMSRESHERRKLDPGYLQSRREYLMLTKYGLTVADFDALLASQGGACAICQGDRNGPGSRFHVDHNHTTNLVRGLLCSRCNTAIGLLQDSPHLAEKAAAYLRQ